MSKSKVSKSVVESITNENGDVDGDKLAEKLGELKLPQVTYENAPANIDDAIQRILELERQLEDMIESVTVATVVGRLDLVDNVKAAAEESMTRKINIVQPVTGDIKITVITDKKEEDATA